jgi:GNAT superfamily N-acetyltransferase
MTINIRLAKPEDAGQLWKLIGDLARFQGHPDAVRITSDVLQEQMESEKPPFQCLVADVDGELIGFALFFHNYSTWEGKPGIYLEDFYVNGQWRGGGVGKMLLSSLADLALKGGCARIDWSVLATNQTALRFYERIGGVALNDWMSWRLDMAGMSELSLGGKSVR